MAVCTIHAAFVGVGMIRHKIMVLHGNNMAQNDGGSRKLMTYILLKFNLVDKMLMAFGG